MPSSRTWSPVGDEKSKKGVPPGRRLQNHLRSDDVHRQIGPRGGHHNFHRHPSRARRRVPVSAKLERLNYSSDRNSGLSRRDVSGSVSPSRPPKQSFPFYPSPPLRHHRTPH